MSIYRFNTPAPFDLRLATSAISNGRVIGSRAMPTVQIQNGTALDTIDPVTMAVLDAAVGAGRLLEGVTVQKGLAGSRTTNYDDATRTARTSIDTAERTAEPVRVGR